MGYLTKWTELVTHVTFVFGIPTCSPTTRLLANYQDNPPAQSALPLLPGSDA
jgi:hypothetical protein